MDIRHLTYFIEVAKYKSFTKASKSLHLSQSTISKVVKSLEEELNVELIDRSAKKIELTDAGEIVLAEGEIILESLNDLSMHLYDLMNLKKGKIKIGIPPIIGFLFFPKIIKGFKNLYPDITIKISEDDSKKVKQDVKDGILDLGVVMLPADEKEFDAVPFVNEELSLFVHHSHPLAQRDKVEMKELQNETFILFKQELIHDLIIQECLRAGFRPKIAFEVSEWGFINGMIGENLGISICPKPIAKKFDQDLIKAIPIDNPRLPWNLGLISKKKKHPSPAVREFIQYISADLPFNHEK
ncbi:LysR family transcriptional regulator [Peribacillus butanolivorans]|uniref:LysR family transcriptional regulator n=1 Tax=Peribacillus butanolivorans TaxID=421767 RepID=A0AAX0S820_9BACI|nr:LysR family transcriptional regulator [Peribacillus butanolivorans]PEJ36352.1 LysR family transcriptional regulator [Peribacillus butanolivorans]